MEAESLLAVYLYLGIGFLILVTTLAIVLFRKFNIVLDKMDIYAQLMIGYEEEKQKTDEGGFGTGEL
jgi:hypothetical protein